MLNKSTQIDSVEIKEKRTFAGGAESLTGVFELAGKGYSINLSQQPSEGTARRTVSRIFLFTSVDAAKVLNFSEAQFAGGVTQTYQGGPDGQINVETTIGCYLGACWTEYTPIHLTCD